MAISFWRLVSSLKAKLFRHRAGHDPEPDVGGPSGAHGLGAAAQVLFPVTDCDGHIILEGRARRRQILLIDDEFDGGVTLAAVLPVAHADQGSAVLGLETLGAVLPGVRRLLTRVWSPTTDGELDFACWSGMVVSLVFSAIYARPQ